MKKNKCREVGPREGLFHPYSCGSSLHLEVQRPTFMYGPQVMSVSPGEPPAQKHCGNADHIVCTGGASPLCESSDGG